MLLPLFGSDEMEMSKKLITLKQLPETLLHYPSHLYAGTYPVQIIQHRQGMHNIPKGAHFYYQNFRVTHILSGSAEITWGAIQRTPIGLQGGNYIRITIFFPEIL
jgi:hypothetical protein